MKGSVFGVTIRLDRRCLQWCAAIIDVLWRDSFQ